MPGSRYSCSNNVNAQDLGVMWLKVRRCACGAPRRVLEVKVSDSSNNPGRMYYKCKHCGYFVWVDKSDVLRRDVGEVDEVNQYGQANHPEVLRTLVVEKLDAILDLVHKIAKVGLVVALALVILAIKV